MRPVLLIPAYRPNRELMTILDALDLAAFEAVIVVDDGSGVAYRPIFDAISYGLNATILRHPRNLGKGAALKTAIAHVLKIYPGHAVVTADADGQHHPDDIVRVARRMTVSPHALVLGARGFESGVPGRSRIGNSLARTLFRILLGQKLSDTQTGLRGIPSPLLAELVGMNSSRYEFEVEMIAAAKHHSISIVEEPIRTIYEPGNPTSHFQPLKDSLRIGFVLGRFSLLSLATAILDNVVFSIALAAGLPRGAAQFLARVVAACFNYPLARRAVFLSRGAHVPSLARYVLVTAVNGLASFELIGWIMQWFGLPALKAKILAESMLFILNFIAQRDWVFVRRFKPVPQSREMPECVESELP